MVSMVVSINPGKVQTHTEAIEQIVSNPIAVPFNLIAKAVVPVRYAEWRATSSTMNLIESVVQGTAFMAFLALLVYMFNEFRVNKQSEEIAIGLGILMVILGLWLYAYLIGHIMFGNIVDLVFLFLLIPVGLTLFSIPSVVMYWLGLVDSNFIARGRELMMTLAFPSTTKE